MGQPLSCGLNQESSVVHPLIEGRPPVKIRTTCLLSIGALFLPLTVSASTVDFPVLEQLRIPPYPYLARLAETEGTIGVDVSLDTQCGVTGVKVGKGDPRLKEEVMRSFYEDPAVPLRFHPCAMSEPVVVHISYVFSLQGQATNQWSQSEASVTTDHGRSFNIAIMTAPPDLKALGLQKIKQRAKGGVHGNLNVGSRQPSEGFHAVDSEARKSGVGESVQTVFTSPNYFQMWFLQGDVKVEADLTPDCRVSNARTLSGQVLLSEEVLRAVRQWQFPGCSSEKRTLQLVFHFLLTEPDSPSPYGNWAPTHFEILSPNEFKVRTVGPDRIFFDEFKDRN